jgi:cellulose biosynthesis protein BcsQ
MFLTVYIHKGSQGKTASALNIAAALASNGRPGIIVDLDEQQGDISKRKGSIPGVTWTNTLPDKAPEGGFVVVDTNPYLLASSGEALLRADLIIVPCMPEGESLDALKRTFDTLSLVHEKKPEIGALVFFVRVKTGAFTKGIMAGAAPLSQWPVSENYISERVPDFEEAFRAKRPLSPRSTPAKQYAALAREIEGLFDDGT